MVEDIKAGKLPKKPLKDLSSEDLKKIMEQINVTYALGENGGEGITSKAVNEEGGTMVTYSLAENGEEIKLDDKMLEKLKKVFEDFKKRQADENGYITQMHQETLQEFLSSLETTKGMYEEGGDAGLMNKMKEYLENHKPDFQ